MQTTLEQQALEYHRQAQPGKIAISVTKPVATQHDLSLAYSPGVAVPCLEIQRNPAAAYEYTAKGNLVAVISNGTAILGLGNLGALASKPVMEGKAVLFKRFADVDSIDIELDTEDPEAFINAVALMEPSFGGINLEDIAAPECFIIEQALKERMNIPVMHDDQHGTAIIVAIFGIFAILVLEFGSFRSTLIVLAVVPLGVFGGMLMLLITNNDISFTAAIGFIALIGIEIKNSILLVDFTNQLREEGVPLDEAIEQAGEIRFLPILLTSATAIGGLLPLAVQNIGLYSPMAWVIIGGLITSTLLARLVTPVMYKLIPPAGHEPKNLARGNQPDASGALL